MRRPQKAEIPQRVVDLDCGAFALRTLTVGDASERWAGWMDDAKNLRLLNAGPKRMTRDNIVDYVKRFDQRSHLLIGIFEKQSGLHIGFFRLDIDHALRRGLLFMLIGEQRYRQGRVATALRYPFQDYMFDVLGLNAILATVLASNVAMTRYMQKSGWVLDKTAEQHIKSQTDDAMLDLCYLRLTREAWAAWKKTNGAPAHDAAKA